MNKVQTGDPIQIKAATWNSFIDAAEYVKNLQSDQRGGPISNGNYSGVILLKNGMAITDVLIRPDANEPELTGKCPAFLGRKVTNAYEEYPYAVLLEPVDAGKIGRALLLGIVPAKVSILDPEHKFAEPMVGNASGAMQSACRPDSLEGRKYRKSVVHASARRRGIRRWWNRRQSFSL